jgi:lipopolysaccharide export system ATP-binding protein
MSTLAAYNLRKKYKSRVVVKDVSFDVHGGGWWGCSAPRRRKTTCFYMIVGLVASDGGEIRLQDDKTDKDNGANLTHMPIHKRARLGVSYLPQENSVFRKLTVADNVRAVLELQDDVDPATIEDRLNELLQELHIAHLRNSKAISLSGGERRRVESPSPGDGAALHLARRTLCRRRPNRGAGHSEDHPLPQRA